MRFGTLALSAYFSVLFLDFAVAYSFKRSFVTLVLYISDAYMYISYLRNGAGVSTDKMSKAGNIF